MSKGIIVSHVAHAKYVVKVQLDTSALEARIETIDQIIEELNIKISGELQDAIDAKKAELAAIPIPDGEIDEKTLDDVIRRVVAARREVDKAQAAQDQAKARRESLVDEKGKLGREEKETTLELWCADYTKSLKEGDEVGLIDWFLYRSGSTVGDPVIVPATSTGKSAKYDSQRDGNRVPVIGMSVNSWWYAMCSAAGVEREMPTYRKATVLAINEDGTLNVEVDSIYTDIRIDEKPLDNNKINLSNVPAKYMSCDAAVFKVDDRVIVEYPPKDIHDDLQRLFSDKATCYTDLAQKQDEKIALIDADIAEKDVLIESYQVQVDLIMADIDAATQGAGIDDLRAEIEATETALTDLASTLSTLRGELDTAETNAAGLRQQIAEKQQQILDKQAQIDAAPPEQDISALQTDINILLGEIWLLNIDLTYEESTIADRRSAIKTAEEDRTNAQSYIASLRDQIVSLGASIEYLRLAMQQELELQNAVQAEKTKLLDEKYQLEAYKAGLEQQAYRLNIDATAQASKSLAMKVLIEKKPKVATVIGFVDHPRPCYAIAYKDQNAAWRVINALGVSYPLSTPPDVIGDFNLGLQDPETGFYDCACVWSKDEIPRSPKIRHDGVTYLLPAPHNNDIILSAGVRRVTGDSDYEIVVVTTTSARVDISVITLSISSGAITDIESKALSLNDSFYSDKQLLTARVSGDAEFFAAVGMNGGNIYTVDTRTLAVLIAHEVPENPPAVVTDDYWQEGIIAYPTDAGGKLGHTASTQQTDYQMIINKHLFRPTLEGGIFFVAMTDSVSYNDTHSWYWEWLPFGFSGGVVDENGTLTTASAVVNQYTLSRYMLYDEKQIASYSYLYSNLRLGYWHAADYIRQGTTTTTTEIFYLVDPYTDFTVSVKYDVTETNTDNQGVLKTGTVILSFNRGEYEADLGIDFNALDFRHYDEVALSYASIDGFIAGCAKISADTYLEFTNLGGYKLVEAASTDYTLLI